VKDIERDIIPSKKERGKEITIESKNIIFSLGFSSRSILINTLIKYTILEWFVIIFILFIHFFYSAPSKLTRIYFQVFVSICIVYIIVV
jgi:Ca2+/Na+ antiporter